MVFEPTASDTSAPALSTLTKIPNQTVIALEQSTLSAFQQSRIITDSAHDDQPYKISPSQQNFLPPNEEVTGEKSVCNSLVGGVCRGRLKANKGALGNRRQRVYLLEEKNSARAHAYRS